MIGYLTVGTKNLEQGIAFYDALFAELGKAHVGNRCPAKGAGSLFG